MSGSATPRLERPGAWLRRAPGPDPQRWLDLEEARQGLVVEDPRRAHNAVLFRQPITTLDETSRAACGWRRWPTWSTATRRRTRMTRRSWTPATWCSARPSCSRPACATSTPSKAMYGPCGNGVADRAGGLVSAADLLLGACPRSAGLARRSGARPRYPTRLRAGGGGPGRHAGARPGRGDGEEAIGGYLVFNDWSARDLQREETTVRLGPAKGKDFASSIGPWLVRQTSWPMPARAMATTRP